MEDEEVEEVEEVEEGNEDELRVSRASIDGS